MADSNSSTIAPVAKDDNELVTVILRKADYHRLTNLLAIFERVDGWCRVNRYIARIVLYGAIAGLIFISQALDAIRNLFSGLGKH